jgi:poly-gamma-glutamate capsule biosynthesis protein CapA/YwtB (metallophosphatase superfamily)
MAKKMPTVAPPAIMDAGLDVVMGVSAHSSTPNEWYGDTWYYLSPNRYIAYKSRWRLKTKQGAMERQKRETIKFLKDLRAQIDDVLSKIEGREMDEHDTIAVESFAYAPRKREG